MTTDMQKAKELVDEAKALLELASNLLEDDEMGSHVEDSWSDGNLWKPEGDHSGKLVVLFREQYVDEFEVVRVKTKDGSWENLQYTGKSNGDRQTWRGSEPGRSYAGKAKLGGVMARRGKHTVWIPLEGPPGKRYPD